MASLLNAIGNQIPRRLSTKACQFFSTVLCVQCDICNPFIEIWSVDWWGRGCNRDFYRRYRFVVPILIDSAHEPTLWQLSLGSSLACPHPNSDQQGFMPCITESELSSISKCCHLLIFPRVIPQAVSVRYGLSIGATCAPLVLGMMYLFGWSIMISPLISISWTCVSAPVAWPVAKLLDWILGANEQHTYKKAELKSFLQFHRTGEEPLRDDEINILNGVLELNTKNVETIMTPLKACQELSHQGDQLTSCINRRIPLFSVPMHCLTTKLSMPCMFSFISHCSKFEPVHWI